MTATFDVKQILTYTQALAVRGVIEQCRRAIGTQLIPVFFPKLSVFIDPDKYPGYKSLILKGDVSFLLFDDKRRLVLACDILEALQPAATDKQRFLEQNGFPFAIVRVGEDIPEDIYRICAATKSVEEPRGLRHAGSHTQLEYALKIAEAMSPDLIVLHEISLSRLVDLKDETQFRADYPGELPSAEFVWQTNLDAVICTAPPNSIPLLVCEIDGPSHDDPKQRIKDQFKDALLNAAHIDVIRIPLDRNRPNKEVLKQLATIVPWLRAELLASPILLYRIVGFLQEESSRPEMLPNIRSNLFSLARNLLLHDRKRSMSEDVRVADAMRESPEYLYKEDDHKELSEFSRPYFYDGQLIDHSFRVNVYGEDYLSCHIEIKSRLRFEKTAKQLKGILTLDPEAKVFPLIGRPPPTPFTQSAMLMTSTNNQERYDSYLKSYLGRQLRSQADRMLRSEMLLARFKKSIRDGSIYCCKQKLSDWVRDAERLL